MLKDAEGFLYLQQKFPRMSDAKIKEGIFVGPQIRHIINDKQFEHLWKGPETITWKH